MRGMEWYLGWPGIRIPGPLEELVEETQGSKAHRCVGLASLALNVLDHILGKPDQKRCAVIDGHASMVPHGDGWMHRAREEALTSGSELDRHFRVVRTVTASGPSVPRRAPADGSR